MPPPHPAARASRRASASAVQRCKPGPTRGTSRGRRGGVRVRGAPAVAVRRRTRGTRTSQPPAVVRPFPGTRPHCMAPRGVATRQPQAPGPAPSLSLLRPGLGPRCANGAAGRLVVGPGATWTRLLRTSSWSRSTRSQRHRGEKRKGRLRCELVGSVRARRWSERPRPGAVAATPVRLRQLPNQPDRRDRCLPVLSPPRARPTGCAAR